MAKKSSVEKNNRRAGWSTGTPRRRAELRAIVHDRTRAPEERFEATLTLAELPRNSAKVRVRNRCALTGRPRGYPQEIRHVAHRAARSRLGGADPGPGQGQLVAGGGQERRRRMTLSDPLGDMLTRIRNGQAAHKAAVDQPGVQAARERARGAGARGLHPRLQSRGGLARRALDRAQVSQWRAGDPRAEAGVEAGPAGVFRRQGPAARL